MHDYIRKLRGKNNLSQWDFGEKLGVSGTYIGFLENPKKKKLPSQELILKIGKIYNADVNLMFDLLLQKKVPNLKKYNWSARGQYKIAASEDIIPEKDKIHLKEHAIPVINYASCGKWEDLTDLGYPIGHADSYEYSDTKDPHAFFVKANGDSMTGSIDDKRNINSGDLLLVEPSMNVENGNIVLARDDGKGVTIKKFYKSDSQIVLSPLNPKYEPIIVKKNITVYRISGKKVKW